MIEFRDGPQLMPAAFAGIAEENKYPDLTYQEWIEQVANKQMEGRVVKQAFSQLRTAHFA